MHRHHPYSERSQPRKLKPPPFNTASFAGAITQAAKWPVWWKNKHTTEKDESKLLIECAEEIQKGNIHAPLPPTGPVAKPTGTKLQEIQQASVACAKAIIEGSIFINPYPEGSKAYNNVEYKGRRMAGGVTQRGNAGLAELHSKQGQSIYVFP